MAERNTLTKVRETLGTGLGTIMLLLGLSVILAACEYPGIPHPLAAQAAANQTTSRPTPASPTPTPAANQTGQGAASTADISLKDFHLDPDKVAAKAGAIAFVLKNEGRYTHDFRVEGQGIDDRAPKVGQGRTFEWQATLPPGEYRISCPISNHADRGMVGTLTVVP